MWGTPTYDITMLQWRIQSLYEVWLVNNETIAVTYFIYSY